jgi:UDP-N-acetylmuramoyl-tripeptide--D-alanyl-D-alanine ligase
MQIEQLYAIYRQNPKAIIDSRQALAGSIFFALRGERFDGNQFAAQALEQGAAYAVIDNPAFAADERCILVPDVLAALQQLARHHRRQFGSPVIGITGSNGKTTTKELISAVLGSHYRLHFTAGNLNNHIGVPLTLLAMPLDTEIAVIEMGANHQGEIDALSRIAEPTHGLITNIGKAHLEGFGGIEGVKKGKSELYRFLAETGGTAFVNSDAAFLEELSRPVAERVFYRRSDGPPAAGDAIEVQLLRSEPFVEARFPGRDGRLHELRSRLIGGYNFSNIMTAIVLGQFFQVPDDKIAAAIESYIPSNNRSQLVERGGNTFVLDAYNANPTSMREAVLAFRAMAGSPKLAIIGEMRELGEDSLTEHEAIAQLAASQGFAALAFVGSGFQYLSGREGCLHFPDVEALKAWFEAQRFQGYHILVKGSRANQLERLLA